MHNVQVDVSGVSLKSKKKFYLSTWKEGGGGGWGDDKKERAGGLSLEFWKECQ